MKKGNWIIVIICLIIGFCILIGLKISSMNQQVIERRNRIAVEEQIALEEISRKTGKHFLDWPSVREYFYCQLFYEGMTRNEVEVTLFSLGEIQSSPISDVVTVIYKDEILDKYLTPILLFYDSESLDANLVIWRRSYEHWVPIPLASCEK